MYFFRIYAEMNDKETSSEILKQTSVVISDDISSDKEEEPPSLNLSKEQSDRVAPHSETSAETQTKLLAENGVALRNRNEKPMSESEIALRDLNNKLKEVQSKLNLNTPVKSKPNANNSETASSNLSEDNTESGASNEPSEVDKTSFNHETPNTINSSTATASSMDSVDNTGTPKATTLNVDSPTTERGSAGILLTPQNEKQVAECWNSLGVQRCRFCKFSTNDTKLFEIHATTCTPKVIVSFSDGIYTCETCELTWTNKAEFEEHVVCHTTNDPYVCINCKKAFESRLLTEQHAKTDHPSGGSVYGLRGMKKSRKIVEELEVQGKHMFRGKLKIPPTPRNKQNSNTTTQASDDIVKTGQPDELKDPQITEIAAISDMASELKKDNTNTYTSKESSCKPQQPNKNTELIEQNMEELRQFLISQGSMAGVSDSKGTVQDKQSSSLNETVKTTVTTLTHASSSNSNQNSMLMKEQKVVTAVTNSGSIPGRETGVTLHYQTNQTQADLVITKPSQKTPHVPVGPVLQPISTSLITASSILNKTGPPNVIISKDFMSKGSERFKASVGTQGTVPQQQRQYLFTEYIHPPPPRPRITVPSSLKPLPTVQTTVQTGTAIAVPTSVQTGTAVAVPSSVQTGAAVGVPSAAPSNSAPILLIPIPPVFNNPVSTMSNVLIPIPAGHQANQNLVKSFVNYSVPNTGASVNTLSSKPKMASPVVQPLSHITPTSPSDRSVLINTFVNSKPQLVLTSNSFATQPTVSRLTPSIQGQHSVSKTVTPVMKSLLNKMAEKSVSIPSSSVNVSASSTQLGKTVTESVSPASGAIKDPIPTVEIFLPDKTHGQQKDNTQKNDANNMPGTQFNLSKRFLFRIRPGHGFVCEACRKFTQDEVIFRRHVWDHFHTVTRSCKFCSQDKVIRKDFMNCKLVGNVVCSLVKKSTNQGKSHAQGVTPEKAISVVDDEVIAISDEEDNTKSTEPVLMRTSDVIILDEEEDSTSNQNSEIKIASTYSLSKTEKQSKDRSHPIKDSISEKGNAESIKSGKSVIKEVVEEDKSVTIFNQCNKVNTGTSNESKESAKTGEVTLTSVSSSDNVEKNENEQISCEKHSAAKDLATAKVFSDEIQRFDKRVLSTRKEYAFYMCGFDQCSFTALKTKHYKEHLTANHSGAYNYVCCHCGLKNYTEDAHIRHVNSHANMKVFLLFNCPFRPCKYKTNLMHMFKGHLLSHKEDVLKCTYCHKTFESVELLISHLKTNLIKFVSCSHCQFKFQLKDMVAKHIKLAHPEKPRIVVVSSQILCLERELNFYSPPLAKARASEKQIDQRVEEFTSLAGDLNKAAFYSSDNMQNEMVNNNFISSGSIPDDDHNEEDNRLASSPPPPVLTAEFTGGKHKNVSDAEKNTEHNRSSQNDTMTQNAEPPRSLMCSKCNFISWNYKLHQQHLSLHETDEPEREKRFVCMYCPKGFDVFNPFKTHVSNHVGHHEIKIYCCTLCVFTTSQRYHIIDHCKDNHLGTGTYFQKTDIVVSKESSCKYCDFKSRQAEQVQLHEKIVHINPSSKHNKKMDSSKHVDEQSTSASQSETEPVSTESSDHNQKNRKYHCHYCMEYFKHKADLRAHMQSSHLDIENKSFVTFKCKYCHFTSTMKALIMTHIDRKHANEQIRILRRIENVDMPKTDTVLRNNESMSEDKTTYRCEMCNLSMDSSEKFKKHFSDKHANDDSEQLERKQTEKETIYIPDGNIFKEPIECPKCSYSNRLRVNILRHIKEHPELVPSRSQAGTETSPSKVTARKSTSKVLPIKVGEKQMKNPFAAVKDAVRELDKTDTDSSKELEQLSLGGDFLHNKLSACFIPLEKEYKCRICQQNIVKKFVLHRHILNHLQVVFFKCHYCHKGDIEQSLLSGHIQQEHSLKQVKFDYCKLHEICNEIKDRISDQNFNDSVPLTDIRANQRVGDSINNVDINQKQSHEADQKDDKKEEEISIFKCSKCDYYAKNEYFLKLHRNDHINPGSKKYGCTVCGYRGMSKQHILRHMKTLHPNHPLKYTVLGNNAGDKDMEVRAQDDRSDENVTFKQSSHKNTSETGSGRVLATKKAGMKRTKKNVVRSENITISEAGVFDMKTLYKCKECGEKTKAKWAMYDHFKNSKCHRRWYRCECCAFSNPFKNAITKHAKIRHSGKKVKIIELPLSAKMRLIKIPVKQNKQAPKVVEGPGNSQDRQKSETFSGIKVSSVVSSSDSVGSEFHTCRLCSNYKSDSLSKLQFHLNTKHQGKPLFCIKCNYKTPLVKHIINHCQNVHKMETAQYSLNEQEDGGDEDEAENVETTDLKRKNDHIKLLKSVEASYKKYKCPNCNISTDAIKRLRDHMKIHFSYKPYVCKYCSKRQQHFTNVKRHVNICHSGLEVKYSMVKDEKIEMKLDRLVAQILKQSSNEPVKASLKETETHFRKKADKRSRDSDEDIQPSKKKRPLIETDDESSEESSVEDRSRPSPVKYRVMREPGTSTKLYQCVQCDYNTDKKDNLHVHLKTHGKKNYKCWYCGYLASFR